MTDSNTLTPTNSPIKVRFIDGNPPKEVKYLPTTSSVAFITKAGDGITIIFKERISYQPEDKLVLKFDDTYGGSNTETE